MGLDILMTLWLDNRSSAYCFASFRIQDSIWWDKTGGGMWGVEEINMFSLTQSDNQDVTVLSFYMALNQEY